MNGKQIRLRRISHSGKYVVIPMDHGISVGPIRGITDLAKTIQEVAKGGATAVLLHKGPIMQMESPPDVPLIMHVSASTSLGQPNKKVIVGSPEEALRLGADALSIHLNIGSETEPEMLEDAGLISEQCHVMGLPLLAMVYPRGPNIKNQYDPEIVNHVARIGYELGADIVKTVYTGDPDSFRSVISGCKVPVIVAGGPKMDDSFSLFKMTSDAVKAGAAGVAYGRNVFQAENPRLMVSLIRDLVLQKTTPEKALEALK